MPPETEAISMLLPALLGNLALPVVASPSPFLILTNPVRVPSKIKSCRTYRNIRECTAG